MSNSSANARIAKNTIFMYIRLFTTMLVGLYTSRVVLLTLGVSDYGLYSVVGGVLAMFTFISGSLMGATSRFFNVEMGKPDGNVNRVFNINLVLHLILSIIIFILAEAVGLWYILNKLNIEPGKLTDAVIVYQVAIITSCIGIVNAPYASLFSAFERFGFLATFDIINVIIRLGCVILLQFTGPYALICYSIIMSLTTLNAFVVYHWIAARDWPEIIRVKFVRGWQNYREVLVFSNWNLLATVAMMARSTGSDLIINSFFGTAVNGAFAISKTVNNYVVSFSSNFDSASGPQIVQSFSAGDTTRCNYIVNKLGRFSLLLFEVVIFPLYIELELILQLWLKDVPEGVLIFCQLNLLLAAVSLTCGGIMQVISASGKIKWFKIVGGIIALLCVLAGYILCANGAPAYTMIIVFIIADVLNRIIQLILMKKIIAFNSMMYVREAYVKPLIIAVIMIGFIYGYSLLSINTLSLRLLGIFLCFILSSVLVYTIGLTKGEKQKMESLIKNKIGIK